MDSRKFSVVPFLKKVLRILFLKKFNLLLYFYVTISTKYFVLYVTNIELFWQINFNCNRNNYFLILTTPLQIIRNGVHIIRKLHFSETIRKDKWCQESDMCTGYHPQRGVRRHLDFFQFFVRGIWRDAKIVSRALI